MASDDARKQSLALAKLAEQAERYEEMVDNMKELIGMGFKADELDQEERNLISVGYKNMMSVRRTSWRTVQSYEEKEKAAEGSADMVPLIKAYRETIAAEIDQVIDKVMEDVVSTYTKGALKAEEPENLVFFHKMEGDYYRYGAEISEGDKREGYKAKAAQAYTQAQEACAGSEEKKGLEKTNPIWLGLALNFSVFYYEICEETEKAKELAKDAFDKALEELDALPEDQYKDSTLIMQLLKDNLTLWNETDDGEMEVVDMDN